MWSPLLPGYSLLFINYDHRSLIKTSKCVVLVLKTCGEDGARRRGGRSRSHVMFFKRVSRLTEKLLAQLLLAERLVAEQILDTEQRARNCPFTFVSAATWCNCVQSIGRSRVYPNLQAPVRSFLGASEPGRPGSGSERQARLRWALGAKKQKSSWTGPGTGSERRPSDSGVFVFGTSGRALGATSQFKKEKQQ